MLISFVAAMAKNRAMGKKGDLPWNVPTDMNRFRTITRGHPVVMGSKTFESLPGGKPLPNRANIVLSRHTDKKYEGATVFTELGQALRFAATQPGGEEVMVIGGGQIFAQALPLAQRVYLTILDADIADADTFFPEIDEMRWAATEEGRFEMSDQDEYGGTFLTYNRTGHSPIVEPANGRNEEYKAQLERILESGICPFCQNGETLKEQLILRSNQSWWIKENAHPLAHTLYHFVITPNRHIESVDDITSAEWEDLKEMRAWVKQNYPANGDAMYVRSGEPLVTGATVTHLHYHMIVPAGLVDVKFGSFNG